MANSKPEGNFIVSSMRYYSWVLRTTIGVPSFRTTHSTRKPNDAEAVEHARRVLQDMGQVKWIYGLDVYTEEGENMRHVAYIKLDPLTTTTSWTEQPAAAQELDKFSLVERSKGNE